MVIYSISKINKYIDEIFISETKQVLFTNDINYNHHFRFSLIYSYQLGVYRLYFKGKLTAIYMLTHLLAD